MAETTRVLHVISGLDPAAGGPPQALVGLAAAQVEAGLSVRIIATQAPEADDRLIRQMEAAGVAVTTLYRPAGRFRAGRAVADAVDRAVTDAGASGGTGASGGAGGPGVVHIHALWEPIQHTAAHAARRRGVPYLIRPCGMLDPWSLRQSRLKKRLYLAARLRKDLNQAAALHFTTERERELAEPLNLKPPAIVEPNGLDLSEYQHPPAAGAFRRRYAIPPERPLVLFLSRLHPKKGLDLLLPAFAQVKAGRNDCPSLALAGPVDAAYRAEVERLVRQHSLDSDVLFTGMLNGETKHQALVDADLFVLPSYQENFGIAVIEALAAGTPVIISDQVNIAETIAQAEAGQVVPTAVPPLAEALSHWLNDPAERSAAGERARSVVWQHYAWPRIAHRWAAHYRTLIEPKADF